jgi:DNA-binding transcriptional regulator GbsR (MarR family)
MSERPELLDGRHSLINRIGDVASRVGLGRTPAQVYALLIMSEVPRSLDDVAHELGISKASASTHLRELAGLGAVRKVWAPETRRDLYEAEGDLLKVLRLWAQSGMTRRIEESRAVLDDAERFVTDAEAHDARAFRHVRERLQAAKVLHERLSQMLLLIPTLFGNGGGEAPNGPARR